MSPPPGDRAPSFPGQVAGVHAQLNSLGLRVGSLEQVTEHVQRNTAHLPQLVADMADVKAGLATFKGYEATFKGLVGKGILLILGAVGSAVGLTKAVEGQPTAVMTPPPSKSASTLRLEAIQAMAPGPDRDRELIRFITETAPIPR